MANPLYCRHSDIKSYAATWSAPVGTIDSAYPLTNLNSVYSDLVTKFTGTSGTLRGTIASTAIEGVLLKNIGPTSAGLTATVTNNNSMPSTNLVIPASPADGVSLDAWVDLRAVTTAATQWNVAITGASGAIAVGKVILIAELRDFMMVWGMRTRPVKPTVVFRSHYGIARGSRRNVYYRELTLRFMRESFYSEYAILRRGSEGPSQPFVIIPDPAVNDAVYGWFPNQEWESERTDGDLTSWSDVVQEQNSGLGL